MITEKCVSYIKKALGIEIYLSPLGKKEVKKLPFFLSDSYSFFKTQFFKNKIVLMVKNEIDDNDTTPSQYEKFVRIAEIKLEEKIGLVIPEIKAYDRQRLIKRKISFVVPGKQMYLPHLMIDLREHFSSTETRKDMILPSSQCLLLYHLQKKSLEGKNIIELSNILQYTPMTMSRAVRELSALGICFTKEGKEHPLFFREKGFELWKKSLPYMRNPIKKRLYIEQITVKNPLLKSNISALSTHTTIADEKRSWFALDHNLYKAFKKEGYIQQSPSTDTPYIIELWWYSPDILSDEDTVDKLSLYLSLKTTKDERTEKACEQLLRSIKW